MVINDLCTETSCIFLHFMKTPMEKSLHLQSCLSTTRIWCAMMSPVPRKTSKVTEHSCCRNVKNAHCQSFSALWGYQAAVTDRGLNNKTEEHPSIWQRRVSFKRLTGSKAVRRDVHDKRQLQTIGGSVGTNVPKCRWWRQMEVRVLDLAKCQATQLSGLIKHTFFSYFDWCCKMSKQEQ